MTNWLGLITNYFYHSNISEIKYYIYVCLRENLSKRELSLRIRSDEYHRLPLETRDEVETNKLLIKFIVKSLIYKEISSNRKFLTLFDIFIL